NILFIAVDDLRPELGCYGAKTVLTPNIDRIAKQGITFLRAYCQQAVCSPSRTSLLTGARPDTTKVWDLVTHFRDAMPGVVTLPQHFKQNGYFVQGIGKIFHPGYDDPPSWSTPWQTPNAPVYALAKSTAVPAEDGRKKSKNGAAFESADVADDYYKDGKVAALAVETLRTLAAKPDPFFLAVGFAKPHLPFVAPKKYWDLYDPAEIKLAANPYRPKGAPEYALTTSGELRNYQGQPAEGPIPDGLARQLKHGYYAAASYTDAQIGKLLDELDRSGLRRNTVIVLWGDHGWKLGEHGEWCKHSNVENDTNAPLLLSVPGMKQAGKRTSALVEFVDVYPTLSELAGLRPPAHLEGMSFRPVLDDPARPWKKAAFSQYPRQQKVMGYSMRTDRYRLTVWVNRKDHAKVEAVELYDHQTDPQENANIAGEPGNQQLLAKLMVQWKGGWQGARP
ncbi:MAG: sulfatase, partial [Bryobacterales bacterium]|nr:sulfatase [Bryobacterales bacterium]